VTEQLVDESGRVRWAGNITGLPASGGTDPTLAPRGLLAETFPAGGITGGNTLTPGRVQGGMVALTEGVTATGIACLLSDVGGVSGNSRMYVALYDLTGAELAVSGDLAHTVWPVAPGMAAFDFAAPLVVPAGDAFYAAMFEGGAFGGGEPLFGYPSFGSGLNLGLPGELPPFVKYDDPGALPKAPPAAAVFVGDDTYLYLAVY
jgi:hypothetical protein